MLGGFHDAFRSSSHGIQSAWYVSRYVRLSAKIASTSATGIGWVTSIESGPMSIVVPGMFITPLPTGVGEASEELGLVGEDAQLVTVDHVEREQVRIEERRWTGTRHDVARIDVLHVPHRSGELGADLRLTELALVAVGHVVHHRVPDRPRELQPVQINRAVGTQLGEVVGAAVVLVDEDRRAIGDDQRRVAAGAIGDRGLDVDRHGETGSDLHLLGVDRADELGEAERLEGSLLLAGRESGQEDRDVAAQVFAQPGLVVVVAVEVRDVEEVGVFDAPAEVVGQLVVAGEDEP